MLNHQTDQLIKRLIKAKFLRFKTTKNPRLLVQIFLLNQMLKNREYVK